MWFLKNSILKSSLPARIPHRVMSEARVNKEKLSCLKEQDTQRWDGKEAGESFMFLERWLSPWGTAGTVKEDMWKETECFYLCLKL